MKRVKVLTFLLPAIILLAFPKFVLAETATFEVEKDSFANQAYPSIAYGGQQFMTISNKPIDRLAYIKLQDVDLPEGAILDQGTLKFYVYEQNYSNEAKLNVGPIADDWNEGSLTWTNKPSVNQAQAVEAKISLDTGWKEVTITHLVRQWLEGNLENKGVFIYPFGFLYGTAEQEFATSIKSRETGGLAAQLVVDYHFEPTPSPTPSPTSSPTPTPTPKPEATATPTEEAEILAEAEEEMPTSSPEESPTPTPETEEGKPFLSLSPGQAIITGLIILALIGAGIAFALSSQKKPKKKTKSEKTEKEETPPTSDQEEI